MTQTGGESGISVRMKFRPLAFLLYFFKPKMHIDDGYAIDQSWGTYFFPVQPGRHTVRCYVPYLFYRTMGDNSVTVDVAPGQVVDVQWCAPWLAFIKGSFSVTGPRPLTPADTAAAFTPPVSTMPAGWFPDPHRRHELRYWNGTTWTDDVSDGGATAKDAM
jgi:uncharacterized protein DUF2510